jgi:hypothetical protein
MIRLFMIASLIAMTAIAGPADAIMAQQRVTPSHLEELKNKLDSQRDAYYRFEMAEQEALAEGSQERATIFANAKAKAYEQYVLLNAQLQKAQMEKREQDKRNAQLDPEYR